MLANQLATFPPRVIFKPTGGFHPISVSQVYMAWWAYRTGFLPRYLDFRVYLALHEVAECRLAASRVRKRKVRGALIPVPPRKELLGELRALVGGNSDRLVRNALSRLESTGLATLSGSFLTLPGGPEALVKAPPELLSILNRLSNCRRQLPVPRRILKLLARSATPSLAATVFGHVMRCVWWRGNHLHVHGSCTAAFISERFGVDPRSAKRARSRLRRLHWLVRTRDDRFETEGDVLPNMLWPESEEEYASSQAQPCTVLSPLPSKRDTKMSPHTTCTQLRSGSKYQQPGEREGTGIRKGREASLKPRLANVQPNDLTSRERLGALFDEAVSRGMTGRSPADRLRFFAAAARASRLARRNPCGFFAAIVQRGLWDFINQADEDLALVRLRAEREESSRRRSMPGQDHRYTRQPAQDAQPCIPAEIQSLVVSLAARCSMTLDQSRTRILLQSQASPTAVRLRPALARNETAIRVGGTSTEPDRITPV